MKKMLCGWLLILIILFSVGCSAQESSATSPTPTSDPVVSTSPSPTITSVSPIIAPAEPTKSPTKHPTIKPKPTEKITTYVYTTRTGSKYHRAGCRYLSKSSIKISLKNAKSSGLTPCSVCNPPR